MWSVGILVVDVTVSCVGIHVLCWYLSVCYLCIASWDNCGVLGYMWCVEIHMICIYVLIVCWYMCGCLDTDVWYLCIMC